MSLAERKKGGGRVPKSSRGGALPTLLKKGKGIFLTPRSERDVPFFRGKKKLVEWGGNQMVLRKKNKKKSGEEWGLKKIISFCKRVGSLCKYGVPRESLAPFLPWREKKGGLLPGKGMGNTTNYRGKGSPIIIAKEGGGVKKRDRLHFGERIL